MMKKFFVIGLGVLIAWQLSAQNNVKQRLDEIFVKAEQCYLMDDYEQLATCIQQYNGFFNAQKEALGDSVDIYEAYLDKMRGSFYYGEGNYSESEENYRKSLYIFDNLHNVTNAMVLHEELAHLYYKMGDYDRAKAQLDTVYNHYDEWLNNMGIMSVRPDYYKTLSQLAICNARVGNFETALSQIDEAINGYSVKNRDDAYFEFLRKKGKILMFQADTYGNTDYKSAVKSYRKYVNEFCGSIEKRMGEVPDSQRDIYWLEAHQYLFDCFRLGNYAPEMLYDLVLFSKDYLVRREGEPTKWRQVKRVLGKNECAIEFVQYFGKKDEKRLGCLLLKNNSRKPLFIDLFSTDSLLNLPLSNGFTIGEAIEYHKKDAGDIKDILYKDERLPELIWTKPLMNSIGDAQKVYFAPDGLLQLLSIEYLMPDTSKTCYRLSSTRTLVKKRVAPKLASALICGGVIYDGEYVPNNDGNDVRAYEQASNCIRKIDYLPGSKAEAIYIYKLRKNSSDVLLVGNAVTDEVFLNLLKLHFDLIHISTHGFCTGRIDVHNDIKPRFCTPLSMCGLLFAGATKTLADADFDKNMSDGVLSSAELARQDLSQTELVVLSACNTGLGYLTDDGVYGIQRGLKQAGAGSMILTLWPINDNSSDLLMRFFYEELENQDTKDIRKAFQKARDRLMQEGFDAPQYANPFILIDVL